MLLSMLLLLAAADPLRVPARCDHCDEWNQPQEPFRVFGNTYWVGVHGLGAALVTSPAGHILLDGALPQSAERIEASIRALGFRVEDVKVIVASHVHFDHVGGIAALQKASGARVVASVRNAEALEAGAATPDDPQTGQSFPKVAHVERVRDGEVVRVGELAVTAHLTPGHTPGGTTWTWKSCEGQRCVDVVYADSVNAISNDGYRFSDHPDYVKAFQAGLAKLSALPCDVLLTVHPGFADVDEKRAEQKKGNAAAFVRPGECRTYAAAAQKKLEARLASEKR